MFWNPIPWYLNLLKNRRDEVEVWWEGGSRGRKGTYTYSGFRLL